MKIQGIQSKQQIIGKTKSLETNNKEVNFSDTLENLVSKQLVNWNKSTKVMNSKINKLPSGVKDLYQVQSSFNKMNIQTQLMSKAVDSFSTTIKRLTQG